MAKGGDASAAGENGVGSAHGVCDRRVRQRRPHDKYDERQCATEHVDHGTADDEHDEQDDVIDEHGADDAPPPAGAQAPAAGERGRL